MVYTIYIPFKAIYIKFNRCSTKLCMNTLYSKNIQIFRGLNSLNSVQWLSLRRGERKGQGGLYNFSIMFYL